MSTALPIPTLEDCSAARMQRFALGMRRLNGAATLALGFSIPLSTSMAELSMAAFFLTWLLTPDSFERIRRLRTNPVVMGALGLLVLLLAGVFFSTAAWGESLKVLGKYRELLYIALFASVFSDPDLRRRGLTAFVAGALLLMGLSYLEWLTGCDWGLPSVVNQGPLANSGYVIFKDRIVHSLLISFLAFVLAVQMGGSRTRQVLSGVGVALAVTNVLCLVQGRTGYIVLIGLSALWLAQRFGRRGWWYAGILVPALCVLIYATSSAVRGRVEQTLAQVQNQFGAEKKRSPDPRLEFYENTLRIVRRHPWFGSGTGSFPAEYRRVVQSTEAPLTEDAHCEYLMILVQVGLLGLTVFLALLAYQWRAAHRLDVHEGRIAQGLLLTVAVGSLFNSLLLGFTGGMLYSYFTGLLYASLSSPAEGVAQATEPQGSAPTRDAA